ncbi:hypothetical protein KP509_15G015100 [Ceratopteris richardii]|nr:hypothetical protein KP509_15G015100 [Ceratopteris richardii]
MEKGRKLHADIVRQGFLSTNIVLGNALVDMYAKCGMMEKAQKVFWDLPSKNVISWTTLIAGYSQHNCGEAALICFELMQQEGLSPNAMTFACAFKACASVGALVKGKHLHFEVVSKGLLGKDIVLGNALMIMYIKCGYLMKAQQVFDELPNRNVVSWTALITGYCLHGHGEEALSCFDKMKKNGFSPNVMTFSCIIKACGSIGAAEKGEEIFVEIARMGFWGSNTAVGNALVDMYAKCGELMKAREVFEALPVQDVISWTSLIAGYCEQGYCEEAFDCFEGMRIGGFFPDAVTFACILKACVSLGASDRGQSYFEIMSTRYGIAPTLEHHTCMITLFGRDGYFNNATKMIRRMQYFNSRVGWSTLIGACQKWGNSKLGRLAFEHSV